nr:hypothetical protein [Desulfuromonadales bacterium]
DELKAAGLIDTRPAVNALAARGRLFDLETAVDAEEEDEEDVSEESVDDLLAADFGEDLVTTDDGAGDIPEDTTEDGGEAPDLPAAPVAANDSNADRKRG